MCRIGSCFKNGEIVFYELNPRLIGHPGGQILVSACGLDVAKLIVDLSLGGTALPDVKQQRYGGFVDIRAGRDLVDMIFSGIDQTNPPSGDYGVGLSYTVGKEIIVPKIRGAQEVAQAIFLCDSTEELLASAAYWGARERTLVSEPSRPTLRDGARRLSNVGV